MNLSDPLRLVDAHVSSVSASVERTIARDDEMFEGDTDGYLEIGASAFRCILMALTNSGAETPTHILDLPCGHGRVLRFLRAAWPEAHITACDLNRSGVDFCANTFGATPVYAELDPEHMELAGAPFALIWVGSLFTHFDLPLWTAYQRVFLRALRPGGLLVFTTHGRYVAYRMGQGVPYYLDPNDLAGLIADFERDGFGYRRYPDFEHYGVSLSSAEWLVSAITSHDDYRLVSFTERGWSDHQDVVVCQKLDTSAP